MSERTEKARDYGAQPVLLISGNHGRVLIASWKDSGGKPQTVLSSEGEYPDDGAKSWIGFLEAEGIRPRKFWLVDQKQTSPMFLNWCRRNRVDAEFLLEAIDASRN